MNFLFGRPRALLLALAALALPTLTSCGDSDGGETVFLFVINGYTAAESLSVYGNAGPVVQGLKFGDRSDDPIEIDRNYGSELTVVVDGVPSQMDLSFDLFAMYPQETGTLFIKKRTATDALSASLFRHVQTIDPACQFTFENGLSLSNEYTTAGGFSFAPEFFINDPVQAGYLDELNTQVPTECGLLPTPTEDPIPRTTLQAEITADPYFFYTTCPDALAEFLICPVWGESYIEDEVIGVPPTAEYFECVSGAITINQPEPAAGSVPLPFPTEDAQVECPPDPIPGDNATIYYDQVTIDAVAVAECKKMRTYNTPFAKPGDSSQVITYQLGCDQTFRIRTPGLQTIFGPKAGNELGSHGNGAYVESHVVIPVGSEHFYVLFGRPVNPLIWQWNSGDNFVDLAPYPYFNDKNSEVGNVDSP